MYLSRKVSNYALKTLNGVFPINHALNWRDVYFKVMELQGTI